MNQGRDNLRKAVEKAVREYNRYRSPEATAKLVRINGSRAVIVFEGSFCETCGINEWVTDMKYVMEDLGIEAELEAIEEPESPNEYRRVGIFRIKRLNFSWGKR